MPYYEMYKKSAEGTDKGALARWVSFSVSSQHSYDRSFVVVSSRVKSQKSKEECEHSLFLTFKNLPLLFALLYQTQVPTLHICRWPQVVYASLEPLVHKYVRDLRAPQNGYSGTIKKWQDMVVFVRLMTKEHAEVRRKSLNWNRLTWLWFVVG